MNTALMSCLEISNGAFDNTASMPLRNSMLDNIPSPDVSNCRNMVITLILALSMYFLIFRITSVVGLFTTSFLAGSFTGETTTMGRLASMDATSNH